MQINQFSLNMLYFKQKTIQDTSNRNNQAPIKSDKYIGSNVLNVNDCVNLAKRTYDANKNVISVIKVLAHSTNKNKIQEIEDCGKKLIDEDKYQQTGFDLIYMAGVLNRFSKTSIPATNHHKLKEITPENLKKELQEDTPKNIKKELHKDIPDTKKRLSHEKILDNFTEELQVKISDKSGKNMKMKDIADNYTGEQLCSIVKMAVDEGKDSITVFKNLVNHIGEDNPWLDQKIKECTKEFDKFDKECKKYHKTVKDLKYLADLMNGIREQSHKMKSKA